MQGGQPQPSLSVWSLTRLRQRCWLACSAALGIHSRARKPRQSQGFCFRQITRISSGSGFTTQFCTPGFLTAIFLATCFAATSLTESYPMLGTDSISTDFTQPSPHDGLSREARVVVSTRSGGCRSPQCSGGDSVERVMARSAMLQQMRSVSRANRFRSRHTCCITGAAGSAGPRESCEKQRRH